MAREMTITSNTVRWLWIAVAAAAVSFGSQRPRLSAQGSSDGFPLAAPGRYVTDVAASEDMQSVVQKSVKSAFLDPLRSFDWTRMHDAFSDDFRGRFPRPEQGVAVEDNALSIRSYEPNALDVVGLNQVVEALQANVASWPSVERASWNTFEFLLEPNRTRAFLKAHLQLGGPRSGGERAVVDATIAVQMIEAAPNRWQI